MQKFRALLIGESQNLAMNMPHLLHRAGFVVEVILRDDSLQKSRFISNYEIIDDEQKLLEELSKKNLDIYDIIIPCTDYILYLVLNSNLELAKKLRIIPVQKSENFEHLCSKIGLSKTLTKAGILTPPFAVVNNYAQAQEAIEAIGFPLLVKVDFSGGGCGVFECGNYDDFLAIDEKHFSLPLLIQKKISGTEIDLSAMYQDSHLIHFSYSNIKKVVENKFGPSVLRIYQQLGCLDKEIFTELKQLGKALGANGFVNIACIETDDKKRYFIEADMRPNAWIEYGKFMGDDPAVRIANWFLHKAKMPFPYPANPKYPQKRLLSFFFRMALWEILLNRYGVWKTLPKEEPEILRQILWQKFSKAYQKYQRKITRLPTKLIKFFLPEKSDRIRLKQAIKAKFLNFKKLFFKQKLFF